MARFTYIGDTKEPDSLQPIRTFIMKEEFWVNIPREAETPKLIAMLERNPFFRRELDLVISIPAAPLAATPAPKAKKERKPRAKKDAKSKLATLPAHLDPAQASL